MKKKSGEAHYINCVCVCNLGRWERRKNIFTKRNTALQKCRSRVTSPVIFHQPQTLLFFTSTFTTRSKSLNFLPWFSLFPSSPFDTIPARHNNKFYAAAAAQCEIAYPISLCNSAIFLVCFISRLLDTLQTKKIVFFCCCCITYSIAKYRRK